MLTFAEPLALVIVAAGLKFAFIQWPTIPTDEGTTVTPTTFWGIIRVTDNPSVKEIDAHNLIALLC